MLKFFYNGIKGSDGKLQKCWYSDGQLIGFPVGTLTIYAREYSHFSRPRSHRQSYGGSMIRATLLLLAFLIAPTSAPALTDTTCQEYDEENHGQSTGWICNHEDTTP